MTEDEIIDMAKVAGFFFNDKGYGPEVLHTEALEYSSQCFERFAKLVAQAEREACAKICDEVQEQYSRYTFTARVSAERVRARVSAERIRARD